MEEDADWERHFCFFLSVKPWRDPKYLHRGTLDESKEGV
jgi:hypothetical protein